MGKLSNYILVKIFKLLRKKQLKKERVYYLGSQSKGTMGNHYTIVGNAFTQIAAIFY